jgi:hypothetical protein
VVRVNIYNPKVKIESIISYCRACSNLCEFLLGWEALLFLGRSSYRLRVQAIFKPRTKLIWDAVASKIEVDWSVEQLMLKSIKNVTISMLKKARVFMAIGSEPSSSQWLGLLPLNKENYVITGELMRTRTLRILFGVDGATAAMSADRFLTF